MTNLLSKTKSWERLTQHYQSVKDSHLRQLFADDPDRFAKFSLQAADLFLDYSKNRLTSETMDILLQLADEIDLKGQIKQLMSGEKINVTEQRSVLHMALRAPANQEIVVDGKNVMPEIHAALKRVLHCAEKIRNQKWLGYSHKPITDVVNLGIGGSDLGPAMVTAALTPYTSDTVHCHFVSNVDSSHIVETLRELNPETTLFIIASKTFTTQETLCNANAARDWLLQKAQSAEALKRHFIGVTASPAKALEYSILPENIFPFWDFVGGRFSLWSAIGLPIAIAIGATNFEQLLAGAHAMDEHFCAAPYAQNMPVILALIGLWNVNFLAAKTLAILPYDQYLSLLPAYLQQLEMESNGKNVTKSGEPVDYSTAPVIWGMSGTNGQHAFHQLLMQGTQLVPVDFILPLQTHNPLGEHHLLLTANCLAQSQALAFGKNLTEIEAELKTQNLNSDQIKQLGTHKVIAGNVPNNLITLPKITPRALGALIALYEHKVFVQGALWGINSFDQWGVELGKKLAQNIIPVLQNLPIKQAMDVSTLGVIKLYHQVRKN